MMMRGCKTRTVFFEHVRLTTGSFYVFLTVYLQAVYSAQVTVQDGTCRWSGMAPGCGNGTCPGTDWYAMGNSRNDDNGNECADGINNLYCCPKVRKPRPFKVRVCSRTDLQGECVVIEQSDTECVKLHDSVKDKAKSVDTYGGCVRLYFYYDCSAYSVVLHRANSEKHTDLSKFNFANKAGSVGPCLRNDFCAPENTCRFPAEKFFAGCCPENTEKSKDESAGPVHFYRLGHKNRTEYVGAVIASLHLNTGTQPTSESLQHVRSLGLKTDVVGMLLPARLGGNGTDPRNLFPLTSDPNIQAVLKTYEDIVYDLVRKHGEVYFHANVQYPTPMDMRLTQVVVGARNDTKESRPFFQDSIGNPTFPRTCTTNSTRVVPKPDSPSKTGLVSWSPNCKWTQHFAEQEQLVAPSNSSKCQKAEKVACRPNSLPIGTINITGGDENQLEMTTTCPTVRTNLYCCNTNKRTPGSVHAILFECSDFRGYFLKIHESQTECTNLPYEMKRRARSIKTLGRCVRLYAGLDCSGDSIALYPGSPNDDDLSKHGFADISESIGPCLPL